MKLCSQGDTLFCGGCGAPFEDLPSTSRTTSGPCTMDDDTSLIFPGHEYSETLLLAWALEEDNHACTRDSSALCDACSGHETVGSFLTFGTRRLGDEVMYNQHF